MSDKNISVDDILQEINLIELKTTRKSFSVPNDLSHIDEMISDILTQKKNEEIKKEKLELSEKEKLAIEREIKAQTKSMTRQLKRIYREEKSVEKKLSFGEEQTPKKEKKQVRKYNLRAIKDCQKIKPSDSIAKKSKKPVGNAISNSPTSPTSNEKLDELKKFANSQHIKKEMENITSHFGNFKMTDESVEDSYKRIEMTPKRYKEYKKSRNEKINKFALKEEEKPTSIPEIEEEKIELTHEPIEPEETISDETVFPKLKIFDAVKEKSIQKEFEFDTISQKEEARNTLLKEKKSTVFSFYGLMSLAVASALLTFIQITDDGLKLFATFVIQPQIYVSLNLITIILALAFSYDIIIDSVASLIRKKFNKNQLYTLSGVICLLINLVFLSNPAKLMMNAVHIYTPIFVVSLFFVYASKLFEVKQSVYNFDYISSDDEHFSSEYINTPKVADDMTMGIISGEAYLLKGFKTGFLKGFFANTKHSDISDNISGKIITYLFPFAFVVGIIAMVVSKDFFASMSLFGGIIVVSTSFITAVFVMFPINDTKAVLKHFNCSIPTYKAIHENSKTNAILLDAYDLFPKESIVLHGIKTFSGKRIDNAIIDAASVVCESRSILSNVFLNIIADNRNLLKPVDSILYEDLMGISAWVDNRRILIGNRELMINHSVPVPKASYEEKYNQAGQEVVYLSSSGELSAAFIIQLTADKEIYDALNLLIKNHICPTIKSVDSVITIKSFAEVFDLRPASFKLIPSRLHQIYGREIAPQEESPFGIVTDGSLLGFIISAVATKKLFHCIKTGLILSLVSIFIAVFGLIAIFFTENMGLATNFTILLYMLISVLIYFTYQKNVHL